MKVSRFPLPATIPGARRAARWFALHGLGLVPVIVYQMAKVGSTAVVDALIRSRLPAFHLHRLNPANIERVQRQRRDLGWRPHRTMLHERIAGPLYERIVLPGRPAKFITLVRDPIARNLSSYFEHLDAIWSTDDAHQHVPPEAIRDGFLPRYTHQEALTWFDEELRPVLDIDVYAHPFPAAGHLTIRAGERDLLVLKAEAPDEVKHAALAGYLGLDIAPLIPANRTTLKAKGAAYAELRRSLRLPAAYIEEMLGSRYARHFYSDAEREKMRQRYLDQR